VIILKTLGAQRTAALNQPHVAPPALRLNVRDIVVHALDSKGQQTAQGIRSNRQQTYTLQYRRINLGRVSVSIDETVLIDEMPIEVRVKAKRDALTRSVLAFRVRVAIDRLKLLTTAYDFNRVEV
jgi:hypothetical protein